MNQSVLADLADLHMHLGSASTAHLLWEMAQERGIKLPEKDYWNFLDLVKIEHKIEFADYHNYFDTSQKIQSTPETVEKSVYEAISLSYRKANVKLLEIRFNPMRRNREGLYDLDKIIFSAIVGLKKACMIYPVKAGLIIEMDRRFNQKQNNILVDKAISFRNEGVVGIDVSGPNVDNFNMKDLIKPVEKAKSFGLGITIHTGEATPVEEVNQVLEFIRPDRIGHGIRSVDDENTMKELVKRGVVLEICPTSNIILRLVKNWGEMGEIISTFKDRGVKFTINSDGPVFLNTNVKQEIESLLKKEILVEEDVLKIRQIAEEASFINKVRK
jgi:adenosine deaminase